MNRNLPNQRQTEFMNWEFGVFFHFGIRTFYAGREDWDNLPMPAEAFNPVNLDCRQWIRTVRDAGAKYAVLVCKHHCGFANWPSQYTDYSVANTPWKDGKGDVVREFVDACREYGIKVGLYYSPAQWGGMTETERDEDYDTYFINQIGELLTNYGKIDYLWFDGCGSENHEYDRGRIIRAIRSMQPEILIFNMWDPDTCWVGNEDGYAPMNNPNLRSGVDFSVMTTQLDTSAGVRCLPAECDCKIRDQWFGSEPEEEDRLKTLDELIGMYEMSVGRGGNLLLNLGPDRSGLLKESDRLRLLELGDEIRRRYGHPIEEFGGLYADGNLKWSIQIDGFSEDWDDNTAFPSEVNRVVLTENVMAEHPIEEFRIYAHLPTARHRRVCVYKGDTVGHKAICVFPTIRTAKITVEATRGGEIDCLTDAKAYFVR